MVRRLVIIVVFLVAGAVVNVAVAWGCAVWISHLDYRGSLRLDVPSASEVTWLYKTGAIPSETPEEFIKSIVSSRFGRTYRAFAVIPATFDGSPDGLAYRLSVGWPLRTLWGAGKRVSLDKTHVSQIIVLPERGRRTGTIGRLLPYCPTWPGFVINTLFYATILWLLILGPFVLRRCLRRRRGLCPKCAYPIGDSPSCTECGVTLPARARAAT